MAGDQGRFVWYELMTTDMEAAKAFYAKVVGWGTRDASRAGLSYVLFTAGDVPVSGLMELPEAARKTGATARWIGYVEVDDVDAVVERARRLGGFVQVPPTDVLNVSRFAIVDDPQMATLALIKRLPEGHGDRAGRAEPAARGRVGWHELLATDWEKAFAFYSELFGWQREEADTGALGTYQLFSAGGRTIGGMANKPPVVPVAFWLYYFNVGDIDAAAKRVTAGGGQILNGPAEVPDDVLIAHCTDPEGAGFALAGKRTTLGYFAPSDPTAARPGPRKRPA